MNGIARSPCRLCFHQSSSSSSLLNGRFIQSELHQQSHPGQSFTTHGKGSTRSYWPTCHTRSPFIPPIRILSSSSAHCPPTNLILDHFHVFYCSLSILLPHPLLKSSLIWPLVCRETPIPQSVGGRTLLAPTLSISIPLVIDP